MGNNREPLSAGRVGRSNEGLVDNDQNRGNTSVPTGDARASRKTGRTLGMATKANSNSDSALVRRAPETKQTS